MTDKKIIQFSVPQEKSAEKEQAAKSVKTTHKKAVSQQAMKVSKKTTNTPEAPTEQHWLRLEKRIWIWLGKHGKQCLYGLLFAFLLWGGYLMLQALNERNTQKHLATYSQIESLEERVAWAEKPLPRTLNNLRGFIFLENANHYAQEENWEEALKFYQKAKTWLKVSPLKDQAVLGCAYAYLQKENWDAARKELTAIYHQCALKVLRAQALYALCYIAHKTGDQTQFNRYQSQLKTYDEGAIFLPTLDLVTE